MGTGIPNLFTHSFINLFTPQTFLSASRETLKACPSSTAESKIWELGRRDRAGG